MTRSHEHAVAFVEWLRHHEDDRGIMAELRRGLGRDTEWRAWKHLALWCDLSRTPERLAHGLVAGGFATHPQVAADGNLGDTLRLIATRTDGGQERTVGSYEGRFRRLLACESLDEAVALVRGVVRSAKQRQIPVNYTQLLLDLRSLRWPGARERTKVRWASAFWAERPIVAPAAAADSQEEA